MKLYLDTSMMKEILRQWDGDEDYSAVYEMPIFMEMLRNSETFVRREISHQEYLTDFMQNTQMKARRTEIGQNLALMRTINLDQLAREISAYLPPIEQELEFTIHPFMGRGGQALWDKAAIDVIPWEPVSGPDEFLNNVRCIIRHEVHHLGYMRLRHVYALKELTTPALLAADFVLNLQMEGGAEVCGSQIESRPLNDQERERLRGGVSHCRAIIDRWLAKPDGEITEADLTDYYSLWGPDGTSYWMGEYGCRALIESGRAANTAACMAMKPQEWFDCVSALFA